MADPFSTAASVAGLVSLALELTKITHWYLSNVSGAPESWAIMVKEADALRDVLVDMTTTISANESVEKAFENRASAILKRVQPAAEDRVRKGGDVIAAPAQTLVEQCRVSLSALVKKLRNKSEGNVLKRGLNRLKWPFQKEEIQADIDVLRQYRGIFDTSMAIDNFVLTSEIYNIVRNSERHLSTLATRQEREDWEAILNSLSPIDFETQHATTFSLHEEGTGQWVLDSDEFRTWCSGQGQILCCPGIPGAGKTVIASVIIDHMQKQHESDSDITTLGMYCRYNDPNTHILANLLGCLVRQFVNQPSDISDSLKGRLERNVTQRSVGTLMAILKERLSVSRKAFIILDALDEYPEDLRDDLLSKLLELQPTASILVTMRLSENMPIQLDDQPRLQIRAKKDDIKAYVAHQVHTLGRLPKLVRGKPNLAEYITRKVAESAGETFLLAKLHLDNLAPKQTVKAVKAALDGLPAKLDEAYTNLMERISRQSSEDCELAKRVISWVAYAYRPLLLDELQHGLAITPDDSEIDDDSIIIPEILLSVCIGLVIIDKRSTTVRFYHHSAKEYFHTSDGRSTLLSESLTDPHKDITVACLTYLSMDEFSVVGDMNKAALTARLMKYPFLEYAARYWRSHAAKVPEEEVKVSAMRFLGNDSKVTNASKVISVAWGGAIDSTVEFVFVRPTGETGLMHAVRLGWVTSMHELIKAGADVQAHDCHSQTIMYHAFQNGHASAVRVLLECGVDTEGSRYGTGRAMLHAAAESGEEELVKLLLEKGQKVDAEDVSCGGETPLFVAAYNGHDAVVRLLLKAGASPNARAYYVDNRGYTTTFKRTALFSAAMRGFETVVQTLIEGGADVTVEDEMTKGSLFHGLVGGRCLRLVKEMLDKGTDVDLMTGRCNTALQVAAILDGLEVAQLLIQRGATLETVDGGRSPLDYAVSNRHEDMIRLLVEKRARVDDYILSLARRNLSDEMVEWLSWHAK